MIFVVLLLLFFASSIDAAIRGPALRAALQTGSETQTAFCEDGVAASAVAQQTGLKRVDLGTHSLDSPVFRRPFQSEALQVHAQRKFMRALVFKRAMHMAVHAATLTPGLVRAFYMTGRGSHCCSSAVKQTPPS
jgi:hypothetical protein